MFRVLLIFLSVVLPIVSAAVLVGRTVQQDVWFSRMSVNSDELPNDWVYAGDWSMLERRIGEAFNASIRHQQAATRCIVRVWLQDPTAELENITIPAPPVPSMAYDLHYESALPDEQRVDIALASGSFLHQVEASGNLQITFTRLRFLNIQAFRLQPVLQTKFDGCAFVGSGLASARWVLETPVQQLWYNNCLFQSAPLPALSAKHNNQTIFRMTECTVTSPTSPLLLSRNGEVSSEEALVKTSVLSTPNVYSTDFAAIQIEQNYFSGYSGGNRWPEEFYGMNISALVAIDGPTHANPGNLSMSFNVFAALPLACLYVNAVNMRLEGNTFRSDFLPMLVSVFGYNNTVMGNQFYNRRRYMVTAFFAVKHPLVQYVGLPTASLWHNENQRDGAIPPLPLLHPWAYHTPQFGQADVGIALLPGIQLAGDDNLWVVYGTSAPDCQLITQPALANQTKKKTADPLIVTNLILVITLLACVVAWVLYEFLFAASLSSPNTLRYQPKATKG